MAVRIPVYEQQTSAAQGFGAAANARGVQVSGAVGAGLQQVGGALEQGANVMGQVAYRNQQLLKQQAEEDGRTYAGKAVSDAQLQWQQTLSERKLAAKDAADGFTPALLGDYDKWSATAIEQAPTADSKKFLAQHLQSLRTQLGGQAISFESGARTAYRADQFQQASDNWAKVVEQDPSKFQAGVQALLETVPDVGPEGRAKLKDYAEKSLRQGAVNGAIQRDPAETKRVIDLALNPSGRRKPAVAVGPQGAVVSPPKPIPEAVERYGATIDKEAAASGVDPGFMRAQLAAESGGNPAARNEADIRVTGSPSVGIAQFQPGTAARYGIDPTNPEQSIKGQAAYMADLLKMFGGDYAKAAAGYNWGEGNVQKAVAKWGDAWRDHIPASTREYMAKIGLPGDTAPAAADPQVAATGKPFKTGVAFVDALTVNELLHYQNQAQSELGRLATQARAGLEATERDHLSQALTGPQPARALTEQQFVGAYGEADGTAKFKQYVEGLQFGANVQQLATLTPAQTASLLEANKPAPDAPGYAAEQKRFELLTSAAAQVDKSRREDPVAFAAQNRLYPINPADPTKPDEFAAEMRNRAGLARDMAARFGTEPQVLSKNETAMLGQYLGQVPGLQRVQALQGIRAGIADNQLYSRVLNDLRKDSPVTAVVGNIANLATPVTVGAAQVPAEEVARRIAVGEDLLNKTRGAKGEDGAGKFQMPKEADLRQSWVDATGGAYAGFPEAENTAYQAYRAYYAERSAAKGIFDPKAAIDSDIAREAIDAGSGGVSSWGGYFSRSKVVRPYGMPDAEFKDKVAGTWATVGPANGYTKTGVNDIGLHPTGTNGQYMIMSGTSWLPGSDGKPILIDLTRYSYPAKP